MLERSDVVRRVLVLDADSSRRVGTCELLERSGYATVAAEWIDALESYLEDDDPKVVLFDVSLPMPWKTVLQEQTALRAAVHGRCPIVLHGARPDTEFSELGSACRTIAHIPWHSDGRYLLSLLRRLLPPAPIVEARPTYVPAPPQGLPAIVAKLLLIDDSEMMLELMQHRLSLAGFDVRIAVALGEVRSIVSNWAPNVILADARRPDIPGEELCARLKVSVARSDVLVLLCSSLPDEELAELARVARADGYVSKSQGLERFTQQIEHVTRRLLRSVPPPTRAVEGP